MTGRRYRVLAALLLVLAVAVPGCAFVGALSETQDALEAAGYRVEDLDADSELGRGTVVTVRWRPRAGNQEDVEVEAAGAARIVWEAAPFRVDGVLLDPATGELAGVRYARADLEDEFGPRPAGLDDEELDDLFVQGAVQGIVVAGIVLVLVVVLAVVLVVRYRRRRRRTPAWAGYPPPVPGYGVPPGPGAPHGYGPPVPPAVPPPVPPPPGYGPPVPPPVPPVPPPPGYGSSPVPPPGYRPPPQPGEDPYAAPPF